ncbi:MAG TPA: PKD domain-containing protein, partial [bacterium]|nr:PKD domain-containing protein [bacterium]
SLSHSVTQSLSDPKSLSEPKALSVPAHAWAVEFVGAASTVTPRPEGPALGPVLNYLLGNDPARWATGLRATPAARYAGLWPGIDLRLHASPEGAFEYDLEIKPGADPSRIRLRYSGLSLVALDSHTGNLRLTTTLGELSEAAPVAWQTTPQGARIPVACRFQLTSEEANNEAPKPRSPEVPNIQDPTISFSFPHGHDPSLPLTIDPTLVFATYSGSTSMVFGQTATYDEAGRLYSAGPSYEPGYPVTLGAYDITHADSTLNPVTNQKYLFPDVALSCYSPDGSRLLYATYLGGHLEEYPHSLLVNRRGELLILGTTYSEDFPSTPNAYDPSFNNPGYWMYSDIFVARLDSTGSHLLASTFLGGANSDGLTRYQLPFFYGDHSRGDLVVDSLDRVYVASTTGSLNFPLTSDSLNFPFTVGALHPPPGASSAAVVLRLSASLDRLDWAAGFGQIASAYNLYLPPSGAPYVVGSSYSYGLPTTPGVLDTTRIRPGPHSQRDGFLAQLSPAGDSIRALTYLRPGTSGRPKTQAYFIQPLPQSSDVLVLGSSTGIFPQSPGKWGQAGGGLFLQRISADLRQRRWSTTIGHRVTSGSIVPSMDIDNLSPTGFLVDRCGAIYLTGWGRTAGLPVTPNAVQATTDGYDLYLAVLEPDATGLDYATFLGGHSSDNSSEEHVDGGTCRFDRRGRTYHAICTNAHNFPTTPGAWRPTWGVLDHGYDIVSFKFDFQRRLVTAAAQAANAANPADSLIAPAIVQFTNYSTTFPGTTYQWSFGDSSAPSAAFAPRHTYSLPGTYRVTLIVRDPASCARADTTTFTLTVLPAPATDYATYSICRGDSVRFSPIAAQPGSFQWTPAASLSSASAADPWAAPDTTTTFIAQGRHLTTGAPHTWRVTVRVTPTDSVRLSAVPHCLPGGTSVQFHLSSPLHQATWDFGDSSTPTTPGTTTDATHFYAAPASQPTFTVTVRGLDSHGCPAELRHTVRPDALLLPNVITPATPDGLNDTFQLSCLEPGTATLRVYNRWGQSVYDSGPNHYDNRWSGHNLPAGTYYYLLTLSYSPQPLKGWVEIIR